LLARTFDVDVEACAHCGGRLEVSALVTDHDLARKILDAFPPRLALRRCPTRPRTRVRVTLRAPMDVLSSRDNIPPTPAHSLLATLLRPAHAPLRESLLATDSYAP
jgi:hypothetical protein